MVNNASKNRCINVVFIIYIIIVLYVTIFSREPTIRRRVLTPLWEYRKLLHEDSHYWFQQITCNILMLVPFGAYLGYRFKRMTIIQATVLGGLLEFDDVFNNTVGAVLVY